MPKLNKRTKKLTPEEIKKINSKGNLKIIPPEKILAERPTAYVYLF